jgi:TonB-dependent SusC/RagA subfamily outer membrane receptor
MSTPSTFRLALPTIALLAATFVGACASAPSGDPGRESDAEDLVRVGYGTQERADVTGSVASVTAEDLSGQEITSLEDLIRGRFPGVSVRRLQNGGISLRIRGVSTFLGDGEPLYVIDGLPINSAPGAALMAVNPSDVVRIDILKDAGSTAIYGSRGGNGVVLITTKRAP